MTSQKAAGASWINGQRPLPVDALMDICVDECMPCHVDAAEPHLKVARGEATGRNPWKDNQNKLLRIAGLQNPPPSARAAAADLTACLSQRHIKDYNHLTIQIIDFFNVTAKFSTRKKA